MEHRIYPNKARRRGKRNRRNRKCPKHGFRGNLRQASSNETRNSIRDNSDRISYIKQQKLRKNRKKKQWDDSVSNLNEYKLDDAQQVERKLNRVSKHRHYAKELVKEQKRKFAEKRREEEEQKQLDLERRQLIRRQHGILHGIPISDSVDHDRRIDSRHDLSQNRVFAKFTQSHRLNDSDISDQDSNTDDENSDGYDMDAMGAQSGYNSDHEQTFTEAMDFRSSRRKIDKRENFEDNNADDDINDEDSTSNNNNNNNDQSLGELNDQIDTLEQQIANLEKKQQQQQKHVKDNRNINTNTNTNTQGSYLPPHLGISSIGDNDNHHHDKENAKYHDQNRARGHDNININHVDNNDLSSIVDKIKHYVREIENQREQYQTFKNTVLESMNAQNTQILNLVSTVASQQTQITKLQQTIDKLQNTNQNININQNDNKDSNDKNTTSNGTQIWKSTKVPQIRISTTNPNTNTTDKTSISQTQESITMNIDNKRKSAPIRITNVEKPRTTDRMSFGINGTPGTRCSKIDGDNQSLSAMLLDQSTDWKSIAALIPSNQKGLKSVETSPYPAMNVFIPQDGFFPNKGFDHINIGTSNVEIQHREPRLIRSFLPPKNINVNQNGNLNHDSNQHNDKPNSKLPQPTPKHNVNINIDDNQSVPNRSSLHNLGNGNITCKKLNTNTKTNHHNHVKQIGSDNLYPRNNLMPQRWSC